MTPLYEDKILVRMFHGSIVKPFHQPIEHIAEPGAWWGGHVAIQIYDNVYGFYYKDLRKLTLLPKKNNFNSRLLVQSVAEWEKSIQHRQETCFHIPFSNLEIKSLLAYYEHLQNQMEEDYCFLGQRCASHVWSLLQNYNKVKPGNALLCAFWPGQFWYNLRKVSAKKKYLITVKKGSKCRFWQGDISIFPPHPWNHQP